MRHRKKTVKLGRTSAHRNELLSNLVCALIDNKRIKTTQPKAKAARSLADKMVTLGKKGTLAAYRQALATLKNENSVKELFDNVAPTFKNRPGGYTRIIKLGRRISDSSEMVLLEWVEGDVAAAPAPIAETAPAEEAVVEAPVAEEAVAEEPAAEEAEEAEKAPAE
ncbi:MAG: 50S ribosomal protein L17 [Pontiellaceae bacterium]|nr:50S ribosomal protein L17 [Pontiellaceae bacterium]